MPPDRSPSHAERVDVDDLSVLGEEDPGSAMDVCRSDPPAEPQLLQACGDVIQGWPFLAGPGSVTVNGTRTLGGNKDAAATAALTERSAVDLGQRATETEVRLVNPTT